MDPFTYHATKRLFKLLYISNVASSYMSWFRGCQYRTMRPDRKSRLIYSIQHPGESAVTNRQNTNRSKYLQFYSASWHKNRSDSFCLQITDLNRGWRIKQQVNYSRLEPNPKHLLAIALCTGKIINSGIGDIISRQELPWMERLFINLYMIY